MPNPTGFLLPGMYVRVRLEQAETQNGILVPQQAVTRGTTGDSVMVVAADGKVAPRPVKIGSAIGGEWLVLEGLAAGETVMVDGFQKLRAQRAGQAGAVEGRRPPVRRPANGTPMAVSAGASGAASAPPSACATASAAMPAASSR